MKRRLACVDIPAFPLQLMLTVHPDWRALPAAVVEEDRPSALIREVNAAARKAGVLPGQRYATALGLCRELRAGVVLPTVVGHAVARVGGRLRAFTPAVEASPDEPGVFWLDATGLEILFNTMEKWATAVIDALRSDGFMASLALAFTRFGAYALARRLSVAAGDGPENGTTARHLLVPDPETEQRLTASVRLAHLHVKPSLRDRLDRLGVRTVGDLIALPAVGLLKRYGRDIHDLHRLARADIPIHFQADGEAITYEAQRDFDHPETDATRLLFHVKALLDGLVPALKARDAWIRELIIHLGFEKSASSHAPRFEPHVLRPAAPGLDVGLLLELVRLRLERLDLRAGLIALKVEAIAGDATHDQARLFRQQPRCDPALAVVALARVRAELGEEAVGRFRLRHGHLPRASWLFEPLQDKPLPAPAGPADDEAESTAPGTAIQAGFVRRIHPQPQPLPPGALANPPAPGVLPPPRPPFRRFFGPWVISGGWWQREIHRTYAWAETTDGAWLWVFWDAHRRTWFEEGRLA